MEKLILHNIKKALNDGVKVNGKIVQFEVLEYKPDSVLGINCWAGEHLNFISEKELDVGTGNIIVVQELRNILGKQGTAVPTRAKFISPCRSRSL